MFWGNQNAVTLYYSLHIHKHNDIHNTQYTHSCTKLNMGLLWLWGRVIVSQTGRSGVSNPAELSLNKTLNPKFFSAGQLCLDGYECVKRYWWSPTTAGPDISVWMGCGWMNGTSNSEQFECLEKLEKCCTSPFAIHISWVSSTEYWGKAKKWFKVSPIVHVLG